MGRVADTAGAGPVSAQAGVVTSSRPAWLSEAAALFAKDLRAEMRTKVAISAIGVFTLSALLLLGLATAALKEAQIPIPDTDLTRPAWDPAGKMALLWVLLCFAAFTGLAHSFVHEEETGTSLALRLSMPAGAVYAGKLAFNLALIFAVALVATARGTGALYSALGLPILFVFLALLLNAAKTVYAGPQPALDVVKAVGGLFSYGILLITVSALTFGFIWED